MKNHILFMETAEKLFLAYSFVVNLPTSLTWHMKNQKSYSINATECIQLISRKILQLLLNIEIRSFVYPTTSNGLVAHYWPG
jgi:hypothetical protein